MGNPETDLPAYVLISEEFAHPEGRKWCLERSMNGHECSMNIRATPHFCTSDKVDVMGKIRSNVALAVVTAAMLVFASPAINFASANPGQDKKAEKTESEQTPSTTESNEVETPGEDLSTPQSQPGNNGQGQGQGQGGGNSNPPGDSPSTGSPETSENPGNPAGPAAEPAFTVADCIFVTSTSGVVIPFGMQSSTIENALSEALGSADCGAGPVENPGLLEGFSGNVAITIVPAAGVVLTSHLELSPPSLFAAYEDGLQAEVRATVTVAELLSMVSATIDPSEVCGALHFSAEALPRGTKTADKTVFVCTSEAEAHSPVLLGDQSFARGTAWITHEGQAVHQSTLLDLTYSLATYENCSVTTGARVRLEATGSCQIDAIAFGQTVAKYQFEILPGFGAVSKTLLPDSMDPISSATSSIEIDMAGMRDEMAPQSTLEDFEAGVDVTSWLSMPDEVGGMASKIVGHLEVSFDGRTFSEVVEISLTGDTAADSDTGKLGLGIKREFGLLPSGFLPGAPLSVFIFSVQEWLVDMEAGSEGTVNLPSGATGDHTVHVLGISSESKTIWAVSIPISLTLPTVPTGGSFTFIEPSPEGPVEESVPVEEDAETEGEAESEPQEPSENQADADDNLPFFTQPVIVTFTAFTLLAPVTQVLEVETFEEATVLELEPVFIQCFDNAPVDGASPGVAVVKPESGEPEVAASLVATNYQKLVKTCDASPEFLSAGISPSGSPTLMSWPMFLIAGIAVIFTIAGRRLRKTL